MQRRPVKYENGGARFVFENKNRSVYLKAI
jgi:hypothetical protein